MGPVCLALNCPDRGHRLQGGPCGPSHAIGYADPGAGTHSPGFGAYEEDGEVSHPPLRHDGHVLSDQMIAEWCVRYLGAAPSKVLFRRQHLSQVVAVELADARQVVIKARPLDQRIGGCLRVQSELAAAGYPCPAPLTELTRSGDLAVTAETLIPGTEQLSDDHAGPFAELLARLVAAAPAVRDVPSLKPSPPWAGWDHSGGALWPDVDDQGRNLNEIRGPAWIDEASGLVREQLLASDEPCCIGHGDWESQNIRWRSGQPLAVHDWDSVIAQPEVAIAGLAAAVWPAAGGPSEAASVAQTADFLGAYQAAAKVIWTPRQIRLAWAAGLWVRLFNAKKDAARGGGPQLERLATEIAERRAEAGHS